VTYFQIEEFACSCKDKNCAGKPGQLQMKPQLIQALNRIREEFKEGITVTSGFRCDAHNTAVGGAKGSQHRSGSAADIKPTKNDLGDLDRLYELCEEEAGIIGLGDGRKKGFIHVDVRPGKRKRFNY
jgi:uncharacterized protein YcbK (DUF882 family)